MEVDLHLIETLFKSDISPFESGERDRYYHRPYNPPEGFKDEYDKGWNSIQDMDRKSYE